MNGAPLRCALPVSLATLRRTASPLRYAFLAALLCGLTLPAAARPRRAPAAPASSATPASGDPQAAAADAAGLGGEARGPWWPKTATVGPAKVPLVGQATLDLPEGYIFLNKADSQRLMEAFGNKSNESDVGAILPQDPKATGEFIVTIDWEASGYIKDDEADKLDASAILESIREGNKQANEYRRERNFPEVEVQGWAEPPRYEKAEHHIVWGILGKSKNGESLNFNTRLLGREGYLSLNLICSPGQLTALKPTINDLLKRTTYDAGKRYIEFVKGKDRVAEFGLTALVLGGVGLAGKAAKVGLLAKFGKVILAALFAMKKAVALLVVGAWVGLKRLFGAKDAATPVAPPAGGAPPDPQPEPVAETPAAPSDPQNPA